MTLSRFDYTLGEYSDTPAVDRGPAYRQVFPDWRVVAEEVYGKEIASLMAQGHQERVRRGMEEES